jgi:hypothetical protein
MCLIGRKETPEYSDTGEKKEIVLKFKNKREFFLFPLPYKAVSTYYVTPESGLDARKDKFTFQLGSQSDFI